MKNLRPHHEVCLTRLYKAISLFKKNEELYFNCIKEELKIINRIRPEQLDYCKITWGTIYSRGVMNMLTEIITDGKFITSTSNSCDSICSACDGKIDEKCIGEDRIQIMDKLAKDILNIQGNTLTIINTKDSREFDDVCNICGTKEKCELIRRATKNHIIALSS